ncbi:MAG: IclR family transcriptional regulator [Terriglobia bacterium]
MALTPRRNYTINSLDRALRILIILGERGVPMRVSDISRKLGIDKSTAYRIISTLRLRGFVEQEPDTRKYTLGLRVLEVAALKLRSIRLLPAAKPFLEELMLRTKEAVHLAVLSEGEVMYVDSEQCSGPYNLNTVVGGRAPLHSSAVGKALLAPRPAEEVNRLVAIKGLTRFTDRTIISTEDLHEHLAGVRKQGWAIDDEETYLSVRCLASGIFDHRGEVVASIGVSATIHHIPQDRVPFLGQLVKDVATKISRRLGYVPHAPESVVAQPASGVYQEARRPS